ncbi:hypothetical protein [Plebeiibacterium sediminum]|uniref:Uncharacterized protein n=1 Tax=Plebeiibacterium sediminum TaxID=2992112 RepID=A0AAE3M897_9BACT|nr:hypothetical protein [Plebeiobacterium sediminum]MCW3788918.1 hypothetical protein [Plebeiobacterium sediminum]
MKLIERIAYIGFWINILFIVFYFVGMPILFLNTPDFFEVISANGRWNPYYLSFSFLNIVAALHWVYCFWFLFKYDRYSKSIFPLFFLNVLYAPIYYYRVKIIKRPLRNKVNKPEEIIKEENVINEQDFNELTRGSIIATFNLWASGSEQLKLRDIYNSSEVSNALFDYWNDYSMNDDDTLKKAFNPEEIELLAEFDKEISSVENHYSRNFPPIEKFMETKEWKTIHLKAVDILRKIE